MRWQKTQEDSIKKKKSPLGEGQVLSLDKYIELSKRQTGIFSLQATKSGQKFKIPSLKKDTEDPVFPAHTLE